MVYFKSWWLCHIIIHAILHPTLRVVPSKNINIYNFISQLAHNYTKNLKNTISNEPLLQPFSKFFSLETKALVFGQRVSRVHRSMDCKEKLHDRQWALVMPHQAGRGTSEHPQTIGLCFFSVLACGCLNVSFVWICFVLFGILLFGFCLLGIFVCVCVLFWGVNVKVFFVFLRWWIFQKPEKSLQVVSTEAFVSKFRGVILASYGSC